MEINKKPTNLTTTIAMAVFVAIELLLGIALVAASSSVAVLAVKWLASVIR